jgi:hypothetical protein
MVGLPMNHVNMLTKIGHNLAELENRLERQPTVEGTGHLFKVATLPAIVLLKLIAYDDRPENA